jgi:methionyl-tRNA formyltransferase
VKFAFAGTPEFAAWALQHLVSVGRRPFLVITRPDRPRGRGRRATAPPAAVAAAALGLECAQVEDINAPALRKRLQDARVAVLVVASFGQILRPLLLDSFLCINIHASLLPAYRGAAPIERALAAGEEETGITIMRITEGVDTGPWALKTRVSINLGDDAGTLRRVLALLGAMGVDRVLTGLEDGTVVWTEQGEATGYADKLDASDCLVDPSGGAKAFHNRVRALSPAVGVRAASGEVQFKIWRTWPFGQAGLQPVPAPAAGVSGRPGRLVAAGGRIFVGCAEGAVEILSVQPSGRARMSSAAFLRGYGTRLGWELGPPPGQCRPTHEQQ